MIVRDILALDRASVRTRDANGFLHVAVSNLSRANICPYLGNEIPDYEHLGLDPQRVYQLFRAPEELEAAAGTFNGVPLLNRHIPVVPESLPEDAIVGSIGNDAEFKAPYLTNSLTVWSAASIAAIETGEQTELSCGYRYVCDLTPGSFQGKLYDGVMRNLKANHVSLVPAGRAGPDCIVGDQALPLIIKDHPHMTKATLSRKAVHAKGALAVYLAPKIAQDAKLDFGAILKDVTAKNFAAQKPFILQRVKTATAGKLAQDASIDDLTTLLDKLGEPDPTTADEEPDPNAVVEDAGPDLEAVKAFLKDKVSPEDHAKCCDMLGGAMAGDEEDEAAKKAAAEKAKKEADGKKPEEKPIDKQAMDAAITASVTAATAATIARLNAVREAEQIVRPFIGELAIAQDSADAVYRLALDGLKIDHKDIKETAALKAIVLMQPKPGAAKIPTPRIAQDAAAASDYAKRFPHASRLVR